MSSDFPWITSFLEDLDFSLLQPEKDFALENYFQAIIEEFKALGREVIISKKEKKQPSNVASAFLKDNTEIYNLKFQTTPSIKIKIEVDTQPPLGFSTEPKLLLLPYSFMVRCYTLPDLFAGKMHALLFRNWKNRVKGRDWYDFEWYIKNNISLGFKHFVERSMQTHDFTEETLTQHIFKNLLKERISETDIHLVKNDVRPFIKNQTETDIWTKEYFLQLIDLISFQQD